MSRVLYVLCEYTALILQSLISIVCDLCQHRIYWNSVQHITCKYLQNRWNLDDSRKKIVLEKAAKQWRDFKGKLTRNFLRAGKDPCEVYHFISREQWETYKNRRESAEFKVKNMELLLACVWHNFFFTICVY